MDFVRRWMAQIQVQLGQLSLSTKMLMGMSVFVLVGVLFLVVMYAGAPEMEPLFTQPLPAAQQAEAMAFIKFRGHEHREEGGHILVPVKQKYAILAALNAQQIIPVDNGGGFADLLEKQDWWQSNEQRKQSYNIALQNELAGVIRRNRGVRDAKVFLSVAPKTGFGRPDQRPSAQVTVETDGGGMNQNLVDAIANQVSGAVSGMTPEDVKVIDASGGRPWTVRDRNEVQVGDYLELLQTQEQLYRVKIEKALDYIGKDKVIVAVNVELDPQQRHIDSTKYSRDDSVELLEREMRRSSTSRNETSGGAPGAEANVSARIPGADAVGRSEQTEESDSEFATHPGVIHEKSFDPGVTPTRVSATISVPRSYFVRLYKIGKPDDAPEPTSAALQPIIDEALPRIQKKVENIITAKQPGRVVVDTYFDESPAFDAATATASVSGGGGMIGSLIADGGMVKYLSLGALAAVSLMMMFMMMRKATQPPKLPSAAELAGIPPALQSDNDVVGEAMEMDAALTGVELDENSIRNRKLAEQVGEMVRNNPNEAASLVGRWIHHAD